MLKKFAILFGILAFVACNKTPHDQQEGLLSDETMFRQEGYTKDKLAEANFHLYSFIKQELEIEGRLCNGNLADLSPNARTIKTLWTLAYKVVRDCAKALYYIPISTPPNSDYYLCQFSAGEKGKKGIAKGAALTKVNAEMKEEGIGPCSANLYAQFLYRIMKIVETYGLTDVTIGLFCKPNYLSGETFSKFRQKFLSMFHYECGMLFNAGFFSGVSTAWGINFTVWRSGRTEDRQGFIHELVEFGNDGLEVTGQKTIYNLDGRESASDWCRTDPGSASGETVTFKSGIVPGTKVKRTYPDIVCWLTNGNNNVGMSQDECYFMQCPNDRGKTNVPVTPENYRRCVAVFGARRTIPGNWINDKDEYMAPNTEAEGYEDFVNDCVVYSLFNTASYQTSLRGIELAGRKWNIPNRSFFMSKEEMMALAELWEDEAVYEDARTDRDSFVYTHLKSLVLSPEADAVLQKAKELVNKSFPYRKIFDEEHPEYQIRNWDAGWYQLKALLKQYMEKSLDEFNTLYRKLAQRIRSNVYVFGFLLE